MTSLDDYLGAYAFPDAALLIVARSERRLYSYEPGTREVRGLEPESDDRFFTGPGLLIFAPVITRLAFQRSASGDVTGVTCTFAEGIPQPAQRTAPYLEEAVQFASGAITLSGVVLRPNSPGPHPAAILLHGSGPQDRNGYVGLMRLAADHLARHGIAALIYDKRGVGESSGQWETAGFDDLASDAIAAREALRRRADIDAGRIGLWGSSQAGWVMARAVTLAPDFAFVIAVSAGGSAYSPARQNRYNLVAEMRANGFTPDEQQLALAALDEFYTVVRQGPQGETGRYRQALAQAARNPKLAEWLPPPVKDIHWGARDQWFLALELDYDPLPAWSHYPGPVLGLFGALDASTPVAEVVPLFREALAQRPQAKHEIKVFPDAHHLLLEARTGSDAELETLTRYVPGYFETMTDWLAELWPNEPS
jgi:hypothetical protein